MRVSSRCRLLCVMSAILLLALLPASAGAAGMQKLVVKPGTAVGAGVSVIDPSSLGALGLGALDAANNDTPATAEQVLWAWFTGALTDTSDLDDVYKITLNEGDEIEVRMYHNWAGGDQFADMDLYLFPPGTTSIMDDPVVDMSTNYNINAEFVRYTVPQGGAGTYYIDIYAPDTSGQSVSYQVDVSVNDADDISGAQRYWGDDRYYTAIDTSWQTFPTGGCDTAVIATGKNFPDALSASGLAGAYGGPLLLTAPTELYWAIPEELDRLGVTDVFVVGGTSAVSESIVDDLEFFGYDVTRIAGPTRYETAALVADEVVAAWGPGFAGEAFVVRGDNYPDALAAAPFSYANGIPILLTPTSLLNAETELALFRHDIQTVYIAGGYAAVSLGIEQDMQTIGGGIETYRFAGADRYQTAALVADGMVNDWGYNSFGLTGVATGKSFPDALAGGAAMGYEGGVLLLTAGDVLDSNAAAAMDSNMSAGDDAVAFGGDAAIVTEGAFLDIWQLVEALP